MNPKYNRVSPESYSGRLIVKFKEGSSVRLGPEGFSGLSAGDKAKVQEAISTYPTKRLFRAKSEEEYTREKAGLDRKAGTRLQDLNLFFEIEIRDPAEAAAVIDKLNALPFVEYAYMDPVLVPLTHPGSTADFQGQQVHLMPAAQGGIDAFFAWTQNGGQGNGVRIIHTEFEWNLNHEDLPLNANSLLAGANRPPQDDHGTNVAGVLVARNDGHGVTGIVPQATLQLISIGPTIGPATAINNVAIGSLVAGDVNEIFNNKNKKEDSMEKEYVNNRTRKRWYGLLIGILLFGPSSAYAEWRSISGGADNPNVNIIEVAVAADGLMSISTSEAAPAIENCPNGGAVYFTADQPHAKYLYATALTARAIGRGVYVKIECDTVLRRDRLVQIQIR